MTTKPDAAVVAAITLALELYRKECVHDRESYRLAYRAHPGEWGSKILTFRKKPQR